MRWLTQGRCERVLQPQEHTMGPASPSVMAVFPINEGISEISPFTASRKAPSCSAKCLSLHVPFFDFPLFARWPGRAWKKRQ